MRHPKVNSGTQRIDELQACLKLQLIMCTGLAVPCDQRQEVSQ